VNEYKIVIDPGHGGSDPGASGNGIVEKNLNLDISKYMFDRFRELGVPVSITRSDDSTLSPSDRVKKILGFYGDDPSVIVISNHINAGGGDGAEVIYALRNNDQLSRLILSELEKEGQNSRKVFQRRLPSNNSKDYYFIHRDTGQTEPVIVEYGFLDSSKDDVYQLKNDYENYAEAVVRAVLQYINVDYETSLDNSVYIVKKGDSLWSIAKKYGLSVDELKRINNLNDNLLNIGQILKITDDYMINNDIYIVKKGDSLYSIARKYDVSVDDLKKYNNLDSNIINIGQELYIPKGQIIEDNVSTNFETYTVVLGDTLYGIANKYGVSVADIKEINNLTSNTLSIGQKLVIPTDDVIVDSDIINYIDYRVVLGDTLYGIANKYGVSVDEIKRINNLSNNNLSIGQIIRIPYLDTKIYTVVSGDTIYSIAKKYGLSVDELKKLNNLTSNTLSVGQILNVI